MPFSKFNFFKMKTASTDIRYISKYLFSNLVLDWDMT